MTNAEALNKFLRPRNSEGSLGRTAQDVHLDSHTAPELWTSAWSARSYIRMCLCAVSVYILGLCISDQAGNPLSALTDAKSIDFHLLFLKQDENHESSKICY